MLSKANRKELSHLQVVANAKAAEHVACAVALDDAATTHRMAILTGESPAVIAKAHAALIRARAAYEKTL